MNQTNDIFSSLSPSSPWKDRIFYFSEVETTMDTARNLARKGVPHLSCVVAETQTKGRGRLDRVWVADKGGLWMTLILRPKLCPSLAWTCNFAASSSISSVLQKQLGLDVRVKWPNDLLLNGKKLAGMISEMITRQGDLDFILLGIGLNVNNHVQHHEFPAISLKDVLGHPVDGKDILEPFLSDFETRLKNLDPAAIIAQWKKKTATIGSQVRVETHDRIISGLALDVDDTGALLVADQAGNIEKIIYGDCFHTP